MLSINKDRCQPTLYSKASCRLCIEACPIAGCLSLEDRSISVRKDLCPGCGICTTVCPSGALSLKELDDAKLLGRLKEGLEKKDLFIGCYLGPAAPTPALPESVSSGADSVDLPCLAILKESHLIALILSGVGSIRMDCSRCSGCSLRGARDVLGKTVRYSENLLARAGQAGRIEILDVVEALPGGAKSEVGFFKKARRKETRKITHGPEYSRRELFTFLKGKAVEKAAEKALGRHVEHKNIPGNSAVPQRRTILLEALKEAKPGPLGAVKDGGFPVRQIGISEGCVMCRRCGAFCPTGALKRVGTEGGVSIEFCSALCVGCHECMEFCPVGAIYYGEDIDLDSLKSGEAEVIMRKHTVNCSRCSKPFMPEVDKDGCPECGKKDRLEDNILSIIFSDMGTLKHIRKEVV